MSNFISVSESVTLIRECAALVESSAYAVMSDYEKLVALCECGLEGVVYNSKYAVLYDFMLESAADVPVEQHSELISNSDLVEDFGVFDPVNEGYDYVYTDFGCGWKYVGGGIGESWHQALRLDEEDTCSPVEVGWRSRGWRARGQREGRREWRRGRRGCS